MELDGGHRPQLAVVGPVAGGIDGERDDGGVQRVDAEEAHARGGLGHDGFTVRERTARCNGSLDRKQVRVDNASTASK
jgi:hypothetical protein